MHDQVEGRALVADLGGQAVTEALGHVLLDLAEDLRAELDVAGLVGAVHVTEGQSGDVAAVLTQAEGLDGLPGVVGGGVEVGVLLTLDAVFLATHGTDLDLEDDVGGLGALEHVDGDLDVVVEGLGGAVPHVGVEHRQLTVLDLLGLDLQERVDPVGQELLGAVVGVQTNGDGVEVTHGAGVGGEGDRALDAVEARGTGPVGGTTVGDLDDAVGLGVGEALEGGGQSLGRGDVDRGDGVLAGLRAVKHVGVGLRGCNGHWVPPDVCMSQWCGADCSTNSRPREPDHGPRSGAGQAAVRQQSGSMTSVQGRFGPASHGAGRPSGPRRPRVSRAPAPRAGGSRCAWPRPRRPPR